MIKKECLPQSITLGRGESVTIDFTIGYHFLLPKACSKLLAGTEHERPTTWERLGCNMDCHKVSVQEFRWLYR